MCLRKEKNLSKKALGESLGVRSKMITYYENGISYPSIKSIDRLAGLLDVDSEDLYDEVIRFSINIKDEMQILRNKMSFDEIATAINSNHRTIRDWHSGKHVPNTNMIRKLIELKESAQ